MGVGGGLVSCGSQLARESAESSVCQMAEIDSSARCILFKLEQTIQKHKFTIKGGKLKRLN